MFPAFSSITTKKHWICMSESEQAKSCRVRAFQLYNDFKSTVLKPGVLQRVLRCNLGRPCKLSKYLALGNKI
jgi:hypothetical protein